jgi:site-specific recombinase XerC
MIDVAFFVEHLRHGRGLSEHTIRSYRSDLADLTTFAVTRLGREPEHADLDLDLLREWLYRGTRAGLARTTLARRSASVRAFTRWLEETGRTPIDVGVRLRAPKAESRLPRVLTEPQIEGILRSLAVHADTDDDGARRDLAVVELLYGAGLRVSELVGADVGDVDLGRLTVRVTGKGGKQRVVPFGVPAAEALGLSDGGLLRRCGGCASRHAGRPSTRGAPPRRHPGDGPRGPPCPAAHGGHPPARRGRGPPSRAGAARPRESRDDADLHARLDRAAA